MFNQLFMKKKMFSLLFALVATVSLSAQEVTPFKAGDRAVFLGNSITDGGHYHSYIWLYYMTRFPDMPMRILNAGIGGDCVSNMYNRFDGDVAAKKPTVLVVTFGMNDSGYFEYNGDNPQAFADQKVKECHNNYLLLEKRLQVLSGTKIVMMGSSPYDQTAEFEGNLFRKKNDAMLRIVDFQEASAKQNHWEFLDLNRPMTEINEKGQQTNPAFTICGGDRIHPDNDGHMVMAYLFLKAQGFAGKEVAGMTIDAGAKAVKKSGNCEITGLQVSPTTVSFNYLAKSLPYPLDTIARGWGSRRGQALATRVVPFMDEMNKEMLKVEGLNGSYRLLIDRQQIGVWTASELAKGINLAAESKTPQYQQALKVMFLNEERWEIERRFRELAWVQFNFLKERGLLNADNREALDVIDAYVADDGWLRGRRDIYIKGMSPEIRKAWEDEMDLLINTIYTINKPVKRIITLEKVLTSNPAFAGWYADPEGTLFDNQYWIYPTYSVPYEKQLFFDAFSSSDLIQWKKHPKVLDVKNVKWVKRALWAPAIVKKDNRYFLFFGGNDIQSDNEYGGIGVAVADKPQGPFKDYLGKPLIDKFYNGAQPIDQFVFQDKDGSYYIYYGGWRHCNVAKLNADFTGFEPLPGGGIFREVTPKDYTEGPFMFVRNGKYYFMWSEGAWTGHDYRVAYAISDNPFGPFNKIGTVIKTNPEMATGAGHHSVIHDPQTGKYYFVYHRHPAGDSEGNHRETCIEEMFFDDKGYIQQVIMTK